MRHSVQSYARWEALGRTEHAIKEQADSNIYPKKKVR